MRIDDPLLPAAAQLVGPAARAVVDAAVRAHGGDLRALRPRQVQYRPGRELVVRYRATVSWAGAAPVEETLLAGTSASGPPPGTLRLEAGGLAVGVWRYPFDPELPGLATATDADRVAEMLRIARPRLGLKTFRPCRRAVVRVDVGSVAAAYLKVVPPAELAGLLTAHERLAVAGLPAAVPLHVDEDAGIVALAALDGELLRDRLRGGRQPLCDAHAILDLLDRLADAGPLDASHKRSSPLRAASGHARLLAAVLPAQGSRVTQLSGMLAPNGSHAVEIVHGDLHDAQLLVDEDASITGLLDVDGVARGERIDDLANLVGHVSTLALGAGRTQSTVRRYAETLREAFAASVDLHELDRRVAAVTLGLATGPFRVQMRGWRREVVRRLDLTERWLSRGARETCGA
jgi:hypothetical protein